MPSPGPARRRRYLEGGFAAAAPPRSMVMWLIFTGQKDRLSRGSLAIRAVCCTRVTVAGSHWPEMMWRPIRCGIGSSVIKNWELIVIGPELVIARRPGRSNAKQGTISRSEDGRVGTEW